MWKLLTSWPLYKQSYRPLSVSATLHIKVNIMMVMVWIVTVVVMMFLMVATLVVTMRASPDDNETMVIGQDMLLWGKSNRVPGNQHDH